MMDHCRKLGRLGQYLYVHGTQKRDLHKLRNKGIIENIFPEPEESRLSTLLEETSAAYCGFDPTSDSLHIGNLVSILVLIELQKRGVTPIALVGEATAQIGDPSGRLTERQSLLSDVLEQNVKGLEDNLKTVFRNHQRFFSKSDNVPELKLLRNSSWYSGLEVVRFLGTTGRHFRMGQMLGREFVKSRLSGSEGMSVAEFSYQMFQAYDWLHLFNEYRCAVQIGGRDQLGNIAAGHDLIRRIHGKPSFGLLTPLITSESGDKYGKSAGNAIWLSNSKTSPYDLFQFLLRMSDSEAERLVRIFSFAEDEELAELMEQHRAHPEQRPLQNRIANDMALLLHGPEELTLAQRTTDLLFGGKHEVLNDLSEADLRKVFIGTAYAEIPRDKLSGGYDIIEFGLEAKLFPTEMDAKRIIANGGLYVNMRRETSTSLTESCILSSGLTLTRVGKKNYGLIKWV